MVVSILGVLKSGGAYVPIDPEYPADRIAYILSDSGCRTVIDSTELLRFFQVMDSFSAADSVAICIPTDLAYVIYTSGSTGTPKGVMIEHKGVANTIFAQQAFFDIKQKEAGLQFASASFDASVSEIFIILCSGGVLYIVNEAAKRNPILFSEYLSINAIEVMTLPPSYLHLLDFNKIRTIKKLITAGEPAIIPDALNFSKYGKYYNAYGPTECSICVTMSVIEDGDNFDGPIPIGRPISNSRVYILDVSGHLCGIGIPGEICVSGAGLARGYLNRPELTAERFVPNPYLAGELMYLTGDIGRWLADGNIEFLGRADDQVKVRGYRIELGEIESVLQGHADVDSCVVVARENSSGDKDLIAYVVGSEGLDVSVLRGYLGASFPSTWFPATMWGLPLFR
ncbi:amino acid adenylation domain-containing protein [Pedobacter roseus]|uniref:Amino acid adenylation domain-containing protein n=2 Tax=Pedobacter roseus TaxID=336820 RepID=A0A7G9QKR5_9SPHI|nr:amino acid adenylation domain-containing protein [Pedobacter roseus]